MDWEQRSCEASYGLLRAFATVVNKPEVPNRELTGSVGRCEYNSR